MKISTTILALLFCIAAQAQQKNINDLRLMLDGFDAYYNYDSGYYKLTKQQVLQVKRIKGNKPWMVVKRFILYPTFKLNNCSLGIADCDGDSICYKGKEFFKNINKSFTAVDAYIIDPELVTNKSDYKIEGVKPLVIRIKE